MTFETNGTQIIRPKFIDWVNSIDTEVFFSCSPKLFTVSGEKADKAIKPEIVAEYYKLSKAGQLKFVVGPKQREWDEMEEAVEKFRSAGVEWPVWIMPTGAREQEQHASAGDVAQKAFQRGYNVAARVHVYLFGNKIGT
jgi:organic radical activating enzyme